MGKGYVFGLVLLLFLGACKRAPKLYTKSFEEADDMLATMRKAHKKENFRRILDSTYAQVATKRPLDRFQYYDYLAWYYHASDQKDTALIYADSMLIALARVPHVESYYVKALVTKGILLKSLNLYPEALQEFYSANIFAERFLDQCEVSEVYINLGGVLIEQGSYQEALGYYLKAEQAAGACDSFDFHKFYFPTQSAINAQGLCYEFLGLYDSAIARYEYGLEFIEDNCSGEARDLDFLESAQGVFYGNLGNAHFLQGNLNQAIELLNKSIKINMREGGIVKDAIYSQIKLGKAYLKKGEDELVSLLIKEVYDLLKRHPDAEARIRLLELERNWKASIGKKDEAYEVLNAKLELADSVARNRKALSNINIPTSYSYLQQKTEYEKLQRKQKQTYIYLAFAALLILALVIISWLYRKNLINTKENSESLSWMNEELSKSNAKLRGALQELEKSQEEKTRIMNMVAHDLRSPMGGVQSLANIILMRNSLDAESKGEIRMIRQLSADSLQFMEQMLMAQGHQDKEEKEKTDLLDLIDYCVNYMQLKAEQKNQVLQVKGDHVFLKIYRERIWRVLNNLIDNAIKFSPEDCEIEIELEEQNEDVFIRVKDRGIGMTETERKAVFKKEVKQRKGTSGERSYGLGLAICAQIMEAHKGSIMVESESGFGSVFILKFPRNSE